MGSYGTMAAIEEQFKRACNSGHLPGVVLAACNAKGTFYQNAFGASSEGQPMTVDSTFVMASTMKLITSISAMQCVERGQIALDEDVSSVLTELKDIDIVSGFKADGMPILKKAVNKITLR